MIRFLQTDNRMTKAIFVVIIGIVSVGMVIYLIPGLTGQGAGAANVYATIYPHWYSRFFSSGDDGDRGGSGQDGPPTITAAEPSICRQPYDARLL